MKGHACQSIVIALIGIVALGQWGCALKRIGGPSLEEVRGQVGVIGVASPSDAPTATLKTPSSGKGVAAAKGVGVGLLAGVTPGAAVLKGISGCGAAREIGVLVCGPILAFGLGLTAAGGALGAVTGALYGVANAEAPAEEIGEAVKSTAADLPLQEAFRNSVLQAASRRGTLAVLPTPVEPTPLASDPKLRYAPQTAADTILEVTLEGIRLTRDGQGANPPVALVAKARARLVRRTDGRELYRHAVKHRSQTRPYDEWAADDAQHLKKCPRRGVGNHGGRGHRCVLCSIAGADRDGDLRTIAADGRDTKRSKSAAVVEPGEEHRRRREAERLPASVPERIYGLA